MTKFITSPIIREEVIISDKNDSFLRHLDFYESDLNIYTRNVDVYLINSDQKIFIIKNHPKDSVYPRYFGPARGFVKWEDLTEAVEDNGTCYFNAARRVLEQKLGLEIEPEMLNLIHKISPDKNYKKDWYGIIIAKSNLRPLPHPLYTIPSKCGFYSLNELSQLISHKSCVDTLKYIFDFKRSKGVVRRELERIIR